MLQPEILLGNREAYRAGRFVYTVEGRNVLVTRDDKTGPLVQTVAMYEYRNQDHAADAAWHLATLQANA